MQRFSVVFFFSCLVFPIWINANVLPKDGAKLHSVFVYFEDSLCNGATRYELQIFKDSSSASAGKFERIIKSKVPAAFSDDLLFGKTYYWRFRVVMPKEKILFLPIHHFYIVSPVYQSFDTIRLDVITNQTALNSGGYLAIDYTRSIYNRQGKMVWTIPMIDSLVEEKTHIRDIKLTNDHNFTFLTIPIPMEIDAEGNVIWKAPHPFTIDNDTIIYHHEFEKTKRGTYMVLGDRKVWRRVVGAYAPEDLKTEFDVKVVNNEVYKKVLIAIMLEFDRSGKLIWSWDANTYIKDDDLMYKKTKRGFPNLASHANAFSESNDGKKVYIGFRDLSRIVRIDKKTGLVETSYGERYPSGEAIYGNGLFLNQHDAHLTKHNSMLVFNNNGALATKGVSSIVELREPYNGKDSLCIWRFDLNFDTLSSGKSMNGGSVVELPNGNRLLCAGSLNRIFEVTKDKKIVWDAFLYARGKKDSEWQVMPQYRCSWMLEVPARRYYVDVKKIKATNLGIDYQIQVVQLGNNAESLTLEFLDESGQKITEMKSLKLKTGAMFEWKGVVKSNKKCKSLRVRGEWGFETIFPQ
jgi:hypothetical protein